MKPALSPYGCDLQDLQFSPHWEVDQPLVAGHLENLHQCLQDFHQHLEAPHK